MIVSRNPYTGEALSGFAPHTASEVDAALSAAVHAQARWRKTPITERTALLRRMAVQLRAGKAEYARLITLEMGKPIAESEAEIDKCAWNCDFYAEEAPRFLADESIASNAAQSGVVFDPLGVVLAIMPWNYPFWQLFRFAAPALAAGNGAILKHANNVPQCAMAIEAIIRAAGCTDGLFRTLLIDASEVAGLIADERIAAITLTGSTEVGSMVASQAGRALKKHVLELGGSDPFIVLADADVDAAAQVAVKARFINAGQSCVNAKRFIVEERIAEQFVTAFCAGVKRLKVGDPLERETQIGPMARANLRDALHAQVERSVAAGATLRLGGQFVAGPGFTYEPTVLDHVHPDMTVFCEETFGPAAAVIRVDDEATAIRLANQSEFGLGASLWSRDIDRARALARDLDAGAVFINGMVATDPRLPFGGIKKSGYGRELGSYGIRELTNMKTVWIGPARNQERSMSVPIILRPSEINPADRGGGARTIPLVTRKVGAISFINGMTMFEPGAAIPVHSHNCEESIVILEGKAIVEIDGVEHEVSAGDTTFMPANIPHRFRNASTTQPMRMLWIYGSVGATRTIVSTGDTRTIDSEHG